MDKRLCRLHLLRHFSQNLTGILVAITPHSLQTSSKLGRFLILALCGMLLLFLSAEAVHAHAGGPDLQHCTLCLLAHAVPQAAVGVLTAVLFTAMGKTAVPPVRSGYTPVLRQPRIRPPPFALLPAQNV